MLAFSVSSEHNGGLWILDLDDGQKVINELTELNESLKETGNEEFYEKIKNIIDILYNSGPLTQTST